VFKSDAVGHPLVSARDFLHHWSIVMKAVSHWRRRRRFFA